MSGHEYAYGCAVVGWGGAAVDGDFAAVAFYELLSYEEADAGADGGAGGEEGVEYAGEDFWRDADAVVCDGEEYTGFGGGDVLHGER